MTTLQGSGYLSKNGQRISEVEYTGTHFVDDSEFKDTTWEFENLTASLGLGKLTPCTWMMEAR
jgi:hypothetical protein